MTALPIFPTRRGRFRRAAASRDEFSAASTTASAKRRVVGDQDRLRERIVFGLRQQIGRNPCRDRSSTSATTRISEGPAIRSIPTLPNTWRFRLGHPGVAGPGDLVDRMDRLGPPGERRHRLRPADSPDLLRPRRSRRPRALGARRSPPGAGTVIAIRSDAGDPGRERRSSARNSDRPRCRPGRKGRRRRAASSAHRDEPPPDRRRTEVPASGGRGRRQYASSTASRASIRSGRAVPRARLRFHPPAPCRASQRFPPRNRPAGRCTRSSARSPFSRISATMRAVSSGDTGLRRAGARQQRVEIGGETRLRAVEPSRHRARPGTGRSSG